MFEDRKTIYYSKISEIRGQFEGKESDFRDNPGNKIHLDAAYFYKSILCIYLQALRGFHEVS